MNENDAAEIERMLKALPDHPGETPWHQVQIHAAAVHIIRMAITEGTPPMAMVQSCTIRALSVAIMLSCHAPEWWDELAKAADGSADMLISKKVVAAALAKHIDELAEQMKESA